MNVCLKLTVLLIAVGAVPPETRIAAAADQEVWVGHQVVFGKTAVPFKGVEQTRSDSYLLAKVQRRGGEIHIEQAACKVTFKEISGVKINIPTDALLKLPSAHITFKSEGDVWRAVPWHVGWTRQDVDEDGTPGLSVEVDASICSGTLHVASSTLSKAVAKDTEDGLVGRISVKVKQDVLGSDNVCLSLFSSDTVERQQGAFIYRRVPSDVTCKGLLEKPWPIKADIKGMTLEE